MFVLGEILSVNMIHISSRQEIVIKTHMESVTKWAWYFGLKVMLILSGVHCDDKKFNDFVSCSLRYTKSRAAITFAPHSQLRFISKSNKYYITQAKTVICYLYTKLYSREES